MANPATVDHDLTDAAVPATGGAPAGRPGIGQLIKVAMALLVVAAIAWYVVENWAAIRATWSQLTWGALLLSTLAALAAMAASSAGWRDTARDIGCPIGFLAAARVFVIGQLGKYVPGAVWMYVLQTELGRRAGIPRARAFLASMIATGIGITAALLVGVAAVPALIDPPAGASGYASTIRTVLIVMVVLCPIALVCMVPGVLTGLVRFALRVLGRPRLAEPLTWSGVSRVFFWSAVAWLCFGLHLWLLVGQQSAASPAGYLRCAGVFAIALSAGMFVPTPGGIGAREILLVAGLTPFLAGETALEAAGSIALASRGVILVAELLGAGLVALTDPRLRRRIGLARTVAPDARTVAPDARTVAPDARVESREP